MSTKETQRSINTKGMKGKKRMSSFGEIFSGLFTIATKHNINTIGAMKIAKQLDITTIETERQTKSFRLIGEYQPDSNLRAIFPNATDKNIK